MKQFFVRWATLSCGMFAGIELVQKNLGLMILWIIIASVSAGVQEVLAVSVDRKERR